MPSTTRYRRGDIVLVSFPFTDLSSSKRRPALVVSPDGFNQQMQDVVLVGLTSNVAGDDQIVIDPTDCVDGILPRRSAVKPAKMFTIHSSLIIKKISALRPEKLDRVLGEIRTFFS
jgi:mRNA interferase MazF